MLRTIFILIYTIVGHNLCSAEGMKRMETPFIAAFVLGALVLFVAYLGGLSRPSEPSDYLFYESLQQLGELGRAKYRQSHHYRSFAQRAEAESLHRVAVLFRAMAEAEGVQCENCRRAIESLGGRFHTPVVVAAEAFPAHIHLLSALQTKAEQHEGIIRRSMQRAIDEGNKYVARMLTWCDASDLKQILILQREVERMAVGDAPQYRVCPTCGNFIEEELQTHFCPHCMTAREEFLVFN